MSITHEQPRIGASEPLPQPLDQRVPMGPFPARLRSSLTGHEVLDIVVAQVDDAAVAQPQWEATGPFLDALLRTPVQRPAIQVDAGAPHTVIISYELPRGSTDLDLYMTIRAGGLFAAFFALGMEPALTPSWAQSLHEAGIGQRQQLRPVQVFDGSSVAAWPAWDH